MPSRPLPDDPADRRLVRRMIDIGPAVVAFSGGVDSAVVAAAAVRADQLGATTRSVAVTAISPAVPQAQRAIAARVAGELGIEHLEVATDELSRPGYADNSPQRCFFCKQTLYAALAEVARQRGGMRIVSGTNADDLGDWRPGIEAGRLGGVLTPLAELGIDKQTVRWIAQQWDVSVASLPAAPCLASRIAYGVEVTPQRLQRVEQAERWLAERGFSPLRVRLHAGELARIEVASEAIARLVQPPLRDELQDHLLRLGFRCVTVDLQGFRSGSLNRLVSLNVPPSESST